MKRHIGFLAIAALLAGCATQPVALQVKDLAGYGTFAPPQFIKVLASPPLAGTFMPIARITALGANGMKEAQVLAALEDKARLLGANALIIKNESATLPPQLTYNPAGGQYVMSMPEAEPKYTALAIHLNHVGVDQ
ncbi:MAG: hypothetical protein ACP5RH_10995 [Leptodesmis sp.]|uniref:hypothetical protein n=1 Tax=Leptodesmis sp. TaxID=3100501 RepID=UPI003D14B4BE